MAFGPLVPENATKKEFVRVVWTEILNAEDHCMRNACMLLLRVSMTIHTKTTRAETMGPVSQNVEIRGLLAFVRDVSAKVAVEGGADHLQKNCTGRRAQFQNTATPLTSQSQSFTVDHYQLRGFQTCLFYNIENDTEEDAWKYHVRNDAVDVKLHVGGNVRRGALSHIRKYASASTTTTT
ncbi:hypothetical protein PROFUN_05492 [Planoprotostelium fungivorum]|uniref:Uncharacterized protein n=1 Tax=Planoprotostelium fungivorum TaxID=1890364 RepID=A0A2P6NQX0_9EUKA|nr:hypothetical protein PROFUN_05492 [Planoprotostelium fungivorum]